MGLNYFTVIIDKIKFDRSNLDFFQHHRFQFAN